MSYLRFFGLEEWRDIVPLYANFTLDEKSGQVSISQDIYNSQKRIGRFVSESNLSVINFSVAILGWLPSETARILWVKEWDAHKPGFISSVLALRKCCGETRGLEEARGLYCSSQSFDFDFETMNKDELENLSVIANLLSIFMIAGWDGYVFAEHSSNWVEFWEGNVYFHSSSEEKIEQGIEIFNIFGLNSIVK